MARFSGVPTTADSVCRLATSIASLNETPLVGEPAQWRKDASEQRVSENAISPIRTEVRPPSPRFLPFAPLLTEFMDHRGVSLRVVIRLK